MDKNKAIIIGRDSGKEMQKRELIDKLLKRRAKMRPPEFIIVDDMMEFHIEEREFEKWLKDESIVVSLYRSFNRKNLVDSIISLDLDDWLSLKQEYNLIQEKKSKLGRKDRERVERVYEIIQKRVKENG